MIDYILKPGTYLSKELSSSHNVPGLSLENYIVQVINSDTCCIKNIPLILTTASTATLSSGESTTLVMNSTANNYPTITGVNKLWVAKVTSAAFVNNASGATLVNGDSYMNVVNVLIKKVGGVATIVGLNGGNSIYDTNMQTSTFTFSISGNDKLVVTFNAPSTASSDSFKTISKIDLTELQF
jgi:hypothetical protein